MTGLYIGLMSGTSLDGVDGVLVDFDAVDASLVRVAAHVHRPLDSALAHGLLALNAPGESELHRAALTANALVRVYADVVAALLAASGMPREQVRAIGAHGQTVRHRPREFDGIGYTIQLNNPALLAELTGIGVIADLRSRDVAAGGQGAPLVPAFHRAVFGRAGEAGAVLNIGGISNVSVLNADEVVLGFDCGPGNALMDHWCQRHTGTRFDDEGAWARTGKANPELVAAMLREPYFSSAAPKSTGRDLFNPSWLDRMLRNLGTRLAPEDVQASLLDLTALSCAHDVRRYAAAARLLLVCGGGALNAYLMERLTIHLPGVAVDKTDAHGLPATQVEACAFAWLARAYLRREAAGLPAVTGARAARLLGALYPAR